MSFIDTALHRPAPVAAVTAFLDASASVSALTDASDTAEALQLPLIEVAATLMEAFRSAPLEAFAAVRASTLAPGHAAAAAEILIETFFGDGRRDYGALEGGAALTLAALLALAQRGPEALATLDGAEGETTVPHYLAATTLMRGMALGIGSLSDLWLPGDRLALDLNQAREAVDARELDLGAHQSLIRRVAEAEGLVAGLDVLCTALSLPVGVGDRAVLADDLALIIALLHGRADIAPLERPRVRLALRSVPTIAATALARLAEPHRFVQLAGPAAVTEASRFLHGFANPVDPQVRSPYPIRYGKPHVDIVWLEITNFCNQKCTFCPDMHREDSRQWLPLAEVKRLIDELAATVSVGSMQLNAYGEPLLHPHIQEILAYINEKKLPWPTFFTSHGLTLVPKKLAQLSNNYPAGIAMSLHNDSQDSYAATRSAKLGDYDLLVSRTADLLRQMVNEGAACHMRLYQMVSNGNEDGRVDPTVRGAFPGSPERMGAHVRKWEAIAEEIAANAPASVAARGLRNTDHAIADTFFAATHYDGNHLPILEWTDVKGGRQRAFMSPRPVGSYANLLLEHHPDWTVDRRIVNANSCGFVATPSLAIFATRKLGICCLDLNSTGTFGSLDDYPSIADALMSAEASRMFAQVANGVATSRGCQICLGEGRQLCAR